MPVRVVVPGQQPLGLDVPNPDDVAAEQTMRRLVGWCGVECVALYDKRYSEARSVPMRALLVVS